MIKDKYQVQGDFESITKISNNPKFPTPSLKIVGFKHEAIKREVEDILKTFWEYQYPDHWHPILPLLTRQKEIDEISLVCVSPEWRAVAQRFNLTMPQAQILKIKRIQNRKLWRLFSFEVDEVKNKVGGVKRVLSLYHGTSNTDPRLIYQSDEGFNLNYSQPGMWGRANYFAANSAYSNAEYAYKLPDGSRQMFEAKVNIGNTVIMNADRNIIEPPLVQNSTHRHDSVQGWSQGSDIYMVYANKKAYPEYLITYML